MRLRHHQEVPMGRKPSFAVATCKIMGWGNNRTTKVAKHRGGKKCACLHMHKKMTYLSRLFQEIRVCLIIKLPSNWMMDNEYAQYIKLIVIVYQVGAEIFWYFTQLTVTFLNCSNV